MKHIVSKENIDGIINKTRSEVQNKEKVEYEQIKKIVETLPHVKMFVPCDWKKMSTPAASVSGDTFEYRGGGSLLAKDAKTSKYILPEFREEIHWEKLPKDTNIWIPSSSLDSTQRLVSGGNPEICISTETLKTRVS